MPRPGLAYVGQMAGGIEELALDHLHVGVGLLLLPFESQIDLARPL